jgi:hypothetical protein
MIRDQVSHPDRTTGKIIVLYSMLCYYMTEQASRPNTTDKITVFAYEYFQESFFRHHEIRDNILN